MKSDAGSEAARKTEESLKEKTGKAAGDTEKSVQREFDEMGERQEIQEKAGREH
jgi:hypothetical protein